MKIYDKIYMQIYNKNHMASILTTSQVQQKIGEISANIGKKSYIITNRGEGRMVILPYFDGCDEFIDDYMEEYEISKNRDQLKSELLVSKKSGNSKLKI